MDRNEDNDERRYAVLVPQKLDWIAGFTVSLFNRPDAKCPFGFLDLLLDFLVAESNTKKG